MSDRVRDRVGAVLEGQNFEWREWGHALVSAGWGYGFRGKNRAEPSRWGAVWLGKERGGVKRW